MPMFCLKCTNPDCAHRFTAFHTMKADHPNCTQCGQPTDTDYATQGPPAMPAHDLHGTRMQSQEIQAQEHEVPKLRKMYGKHGDCWQADGSVKFKNRADAKGFFAKDREIRRKFAEQKAAGKLKTKKERNAERNGVQVLKRGK